MPGEWFQIFQIVQWLAMITAGVVVAIWDRQRKAERELLDDKLRNMADRVTASELEYRLRVDRINEQLSGKLMPMMQAVIGRMDRLPDDLREKFLPLDRANDLFEASRRDRAEIWQELQRRGNRGEPR